MTIEGVDAGLRSRCPRARGEVSGAGPPAVGTGFVLTEHLILDVAYRYFDLGRVETSPGNMYMDTKPAGIAINGIETRLRSHGPAAGLRYQF